MITKIDAIFSLVPNSEFVIRGDEIEWHVPSTAPVADAQIATELAKLQSEYDAKEYQRLRKYPSIGDQLDMLWHAIDSGTLNKTSDFYTAIKAVKDAHPKE